MKFTLVCALLSVASLGSAGTAQPGKAAAPANENGVVRVKGGDVVVLSGNGGRNSNNQIVIVDNSNSNGDAVVADKNGLADIILIQGQNSYTMNQGQVKGGQVSTVTKTITSTVTATITSSVNLQTGAQVLTASKITTTANTVLPANTHAAAHYHTPVVRRRR